MILVIFIDPVSISRCSAAYTQPNVIYFIQTPPGPYAGAYLTKLLNYLYIIRPTALF